METSGQKLINELTCVMSGPPLDPYLNKPIIKKKVCKTIGKRIALPRDLILRNY